MRISKTSLFLGIAALAWLLASSSHVYAMISIDMVTKEKAKQLGIEVRTIQPRPDDARVELEFETKGDLKKYFRVDLDVNEGGKMQLYATLRDESTKPGHVIVSFSADRETLEKTTLRIIVGSPGLLSGHDIRVKDFVTLEPVKPPQTQR